MKLSSTIQFFCLLQFQIDNDFCILLLCSLKKKTNFPHFFRDRTHTLNPTSKNQPSPSPVPAPFFLNQPPPTPSPTPIYSFPIRAHFRNRTCQIKGYMHTEPVVRTHSRTMVRVRVRVRNASPHFVVWCKLR